MTTRPPKRGSCTDGLTQHDFYPLTAALRVADTNVKAALAMLKMCRREADAEAHRVVATCGGGISNSAL